jgi:hypothetical protein
VERADDEIRDGKDEGIGSKRRGRREGDDEHGGGRGEHGQADAAFLRVEGIRQPGVCRPCPPQNCEEEEAAKQPLPGLVLREEIGDLGDGEDEHEIEEQLEWSDPLLALDRPNVHRLAA